MYRLLPLLSLAVLGAREANGQTAQLSLDPLMSFIGCLKEVRPGYCISERALGFFEQWLTGDEDEVPGDPNNHDDDPGERLSPYWKTMVNTVAERIAGFYHTDDEEDDEKDGAEKKEGEERKSTDIEAREKKYKKDRRVKVAMTIILLVIYFIVSQLFYMLDKVARTALFAKLILAFKIFVLVKLVELKRYIWWVKEEKKEEHHEVSVHDHHWDEPHHYDHHYDHGHYDHHDSGHHDYPPWSGGWHGRADPYRAHDPKYGPPALAAR